MAKKIVFVRDLEAYHVEQVQAAAPGWEVVFGGNPEIWNPHVSDAEIIVGWGKKVESVCFAHKDIPLRWVQNWGAGVDHIALDEFSRRGILLTTASGVHPYPISETIFAMALAFTRNLHKYIRNQRESRWADGDSMVELHGKCMAILGVGAIGEETAKIAKAFGMKTVGVRKSKTTCPWIDVMFSPEDLHSALAQSDFVINTLPLTQDTFHLIGEEEFNRMKPSAFYVNIGRGATTDTKALLTALQTGNIAGAGLDVFEEEPLPGDHPLWTLENVILTPHTSGSTEHYNDRVIEIFLENLRDYVAGETPSRNRVNLELQY